MNLFSSVFLSSGLGVVLQVKATVIAEAVRMAERKKSLRMALKFDEVKVTSPKGLRHPGPMVNPAKGWYGWVKNDRQPITNLYETTNYKLS